MMLPHIIQFQQKGKEEEGYLSIVSNQELPFEIKRVFWAYGTPEHQMRGKHAHKKTEMVLIAVNGEIVVTCTVMPNYTKDFTLNNANVGLYIPALCWHTMKYTKNAVQLVLVNSLYDENDYIRDYKQFLKASRV